MRRLLLLAALALPAGACGTDDWGPAELREGKSSQDAKLLGRGRAQYALYCAGCHGEQGDGNGPASKFLNPKPRDFRVGRIKFTAVPANSPPTDEDYLKVIRHGLKGTAMPNWELLPINDQKAIVAYLRTFYKDWANDSPNPIIAIPPDPWKAHPADGVAEGEKLYHGFAACFNCHPAYVTKPQIVADSAAYKLTITEFRAGLYDSVEKESDWGANILPPNFTVDRLKFASDIDLLAQVIATGVGGTAMPSWGTSLTPEQLWGLAHYVDSLTAMRGTPRAAALRRALDAQPPYTPPAPPPEAPTPAAPAPAAPTRGN